MIGFRVHRQEMPSIFLFSLRATVDMEISPAGSNGPVIFAPSLLTWPLVRTLGTSWRTVYVWGWYMPDWWLDVMQLHLVKPSVQHVGSLHLQEWNHVHCVPVRVPDMPVWDPLLRSPNLSRVIPSCARLCSWFWWLISSVVDQQHWNIQEAKMKAQSTGAFLAHCIHWATFARQRLRSLEFPTGPSWKTISKAHIFAGGSPTWIRRADLWSLRQVLALFFIFRRDARYPARLCEVLAKAHIQYAMELTTSNESAEAREDLMAAVSALCGHFDPYLTNSKGSVMRLEVNDVEQIRCRDFPAPQRLLLGIACRRPSDSGCVE